MKTGANRTDQNAIKRMHDDGDDVDHISRTLQIEPDVVKAFIPKAKESKSKSKLADKFDK